MGLKTSRRRFAEYRQTLQQNRDKKEEGESPRAGETARTRTTGQLLRQFLELLRGETVPLVFALATLTLATIVRLGPPLATKVVIDNVLTAQTLPGEWHDREHSA